MIPENQQTLINKFGLEVILFFCGTITPKYQPSALSQGKSRLRGAVHHGEA